ncbi:MAG TPA: serine hydrolase, partial [Chitinophagaceae bacterium]|nr:serine hydrolase [Chitinophagaceae bacterium]
FPIIAGFGAKNLCSCMFVSGRLESDVKQEELGGFPFSLGSYEVDMTDSSVTGRVWGVAKRRAIFRKGLGCTLVNDFSESTIRQQSFDLGHELPGNPDSIPWPDGDLLTDSFPTDVNRAQLNRAVAAAFGEPDSAKSRRTRAVVVLYNGQLVAEQYAEGFNQKSVMHGWSVAKSFVAAFIGILVNENRLNVSDPAPVPAWKAGDLRHEITLQHLLQQTSGLDFSEDYSGYSDVTNMLFNKGDMAGFSESLRLKHRPGTIFNYSSGNSNILSKIVRATIGENEYHSFPRTRFFQKIGMRSALLEPDASGTFVTSSYIFATARDYARFGLLFYNNGRWKNEQILPVDWVNQTRIPATTNNLRNYGYQFWLKGLDKRYPHEPNFPDVPADLYYADGYAYQDIYIIPSKKLVVVRLGLTLDGSFDENEFLKQILMAIKK